MAVSDDIQQGRMRCVVSHQLLQAASADALVTRDGRTQYPIINGVPHILRDRARVDAYLSANPAMQTEYAAAPTQASPSPWLCTCLRHIRGWLSNDHRTEASKAAFQQLMAGATAGSVYLSIGGGPVRNHPQLTNLNIGAFPNVDVVADAHELPYADGAVDGIFCEAVLEHLSEPDTAVAEMFRVLKPNGLIFAATPFLQAFHGYPNHFQNYTLFGHERLFTRHGFTILQSGCCVGPINAILTLTARAIGLYLPSLFGKGLKAAFQLITLPLRPLDRVLANRPDTNHLLASTTFVLAKK
jgi:SAM-dependent methyltransferase/uncharacterized protein YbaR (Trm112 family)